MSTIEPPVPEGSGTDTSVALRGLSLHPSIEIRMLTAADEMVEAVELFKQVWGSPTELVRLEMMMAISHSGGYVSAAYDTGHDEPTILGASVGILARHLDRPALHSHVTGLLPGARSIGLGRSMKLHQRAWAADRGLEWIVWTYDPLVRRNAWFNIAVLGVEVHEYLESFYGEMTDAINVGDESDRLLVAWNVLADLPDDARDGHDMTETQLVPTPEDIVALRRTDPAAVGQWRAETREALSAALAAGRAVVGFTRDGEYVIAER